MEGFRGLKTILHFFGPWFTVDVGDLLKGGMRDNFEICMHFVLDNRSQSFSPK